MASFNSSDELKAIGNDCFKKGDFIGAEVAFTQALELFEPTAILYSNRAAARFHLGKFEESLSDTDESIKIDPKWGKAYYRKVCALESLNMHKEAYDCWKLASKNCDGTAWLKTQAIEGKMKWIDQMRLTKVTDSSDLIERYKLLTDSRERLSTLAHFWNESTKEERLKVIQRFAAIISGPSGPSESMMAALASIDLDPLPMDNYQDLPIEKIAAWHRFYIEQEIDCKVEICENIWGALAPAEQDAVIKDLKFFILK